MRTNGSSVQEKSKKDEERSPFTKPRQSGSCLYRLYYSFVCLTRAKQSVLEDAIADRMPEFLQEVCTRYEYDLIGYQIRSHQVQVVISAKPSVPPSEIVGNLKRATAHHVFEQFPELELRLGKRSLWAEGYFAESLNWKQIDLLLKTMTRSGSPAVIQTAVVETVDGAEEVKPREVARPRRLTPAIIDEFLDHLLPTEQQVLILLYGLRGERAREPEQVGIVLTLQTDEVKQIAEEAIRKLRVIAEDSESSAEAEV